MMGLLKCILECVRQFSFPISMSCMLYMQGGSVRVWVQCMDLLQGVAGVGVSVLCMWACQRDIHSPISNVGCLVCGCPRAWSLPSLKSQGRRVLNMVMFASTPIGGWVLLHSGSCRRYRPSVGRGLRVSHGGSVPCSVSNQPSSTHVVLGREWRPQSIINIIFLASHAITLSA